MSASLYAQPQLPIAPEREREAVRRPGPVTLRAAPRREPPFDDELPVGDAHRPVRLAGPGEQPLPFERQPAVRARAGHRPSWVGSLTAARADLPDPGPWARRLLVTLLETRAGQRPIRQLANYLSPAVHAGLINSLAGVPAPSPGHRPPAVTSVHVFEPAAGIAEISAVICTGARYRAVAARLEATDGHWRCVRLQLG